MRFSLIAFLTAFSLSQNPAWRAVDLRGPSGPADGASCRWDDPGDVTMFRRSGGQLEVNCAAASPRVLHCDPPGFEPRDIDAATLCKAPAVSFDPAGGRFVEVTPPGEFDVVWLRGAGSSAERRATRRFQGAGPFLIPIASGSFVRLVTAIGSPTTLVGPSTAPDARFSFTRDQPGGELFVRPETSPVAPIRVDVAGAGTRGSCPGQPCSLPGMPADLYSVARIYEGGVATTPVRARLENGRATDVWLPAERVGGLDLTVAGALCAGATKVALTRTSQAARPAPRAMPPGPSRGRGAPVGPSAANALAVTLTNCRARLGGLAPGAYMVTLGGERPGEPTVSQPTEIRPQAWTALAIDSPPVTATGVVSMAARSVPRARLQFVQISPANATNTSHQVTADESGAYSVGLPAHGSYIVRAMSAGNSDPWITRVDLASGANALNIDLESVTLRVTAARPPATGRSNGAPSVTLYVDGPRWQKTFVVPFPAQDSQAVFELAGLAPGTYGVWASTDAGPSTEYKRLALSPQSQQAIAFQDYASSAGTLEVRGMAGPPLNLKAALSLSGSPLPSVRPGRFTNISTVAPGAPVFLSTPRAATCASYTPGRQMVSLPDRVAEVGLRFEKLAPSLAADVYGRIVNMSGATCAPYLQQFPTRPAPYRSDRFEAYFVTLPVGSLRLERGGTTVAISVPGPTVTIK